VRYLLDVNALVALGFLNHEFHERVARWLLSLRKGTPYEILTCPITELGFDRFMFWEASKPISGKQGHAGRSPAELAL
jgi:hypothetical protein